MYMYLQKNWKSLQDKDNKRYDNVMNWKNVLINNIFGILKNMRQMW
jgi:hypothetical protein